MTNSYSAEIPKCLF